MTRYVSLSTDANPRYSVYAPIVCRLWQALGWEPVVAIHPHGWDTAYGQVVRHWLRERNTIEYDAETFASMSMPNSMRVVRLAAPCLSGIGDDDLIMMSDMDMIPLSRTFFDVNWDLFALRADMHGFLQEQLLPSKFRFTMCYVGARARIWREIFRPVPDDVQASMAALDVYTADELARIHAQGGSTEKSGTPEHDADEAWMSAHILASDRVYGHAVEKTDLRHDGYQVHTQGPMRLVPTRQKLGWPDRMMILGEHRAYGGSAPSSALDWHSSSRAGSWLGYEVAQLWPEESGWIKQYWAEISRLTKLTD